MNAFVWTKLDPIDPLTIKKKKFFPEKMGL